MSMPADVRVETTRIDARPRWRRLVGPVVTACSVGAATLVLRFVDPNGPSPLPMCPTRLLFGVDCPGCGGLRATHALANGDIANAMDNNLLFVVLVPLLIAGWVVWFVRAWTGRSPDPARRIPRWQRAFPIVLAIVLLVFGIVRNFTPYLGSGVG